MSYWDISEMSLNVDLIQRVQACAAQEYPDTNPYVWQAEHILAVCAAPGWDAAWASAVASGVARPGKDAGVISDGEILASVQGLGDA